MDFDLTKEQQDIQRAAREFARGEFPARAQEFDRSETFDLDIWRKACELGFVGVFIDEAYGGAGLGFFEHCLITEEFWAVDAGMYVFVNTHHEADGNGGFNAFFRFRTAGESHFGS